VFALALLLALGQVARAEPISWSYSWSSSPGVVTSDDGSLGKVTFSPVSGGPLLGSRTGGDGITAADLHATVPAAGTADFTNRGYGLTLHLTDNASGQSADVSFSGLLNGSLGGTGSLTNSFVGEPSKSLNLGANQYTVTAGLFVSPLADAPGRIGANVTVAGSGDPVPPPVNEVPEPTGLLLAGIGLSALAARRWRRR
jgi:hypothetical protein